MVKIKSGIFNVVLGSYNLTLFPRGQVVKYFGYFIVGILALLLIGVAAFWLSAQMSLDRSYTHSKRTAELPFFDSGSKEGLVQISTDRGDFRARAAGFEGPEKKPLVVLLHGFPVTSAMWLDLIPVLAEAGYRVVAFDQRGYSPQTRPARIDQYVVSELVDDVFAVADALGGERFHLVGHDWGAGVGWGVVLAKPDRVLSWTPLSIAHPAAFGAALQNDPDQQSRSSYFTLFVTPGVPETLFTFNDLRLLKSAYGGMRAEKVDEYVSVFSEPGALTAGLNWYRASFGGDPASTEVQENDVRVPTLFIWGNQDEAVGRLGTELMSEYMKGPYSIIELNAGHWLLSETPEKVIPPIVSHIRANSDS
tara:strand:+ start:180 stop:1271 length:1092 start_codon:yes stop_codon:yes gene_type:complete